MKISFTCINFNNYRITLNYIESVRALSSGHDIKIVVVDNGSRPDDVNALEAAIGNAADVKLIKSATNLGYFKGLNLGLKWALAHGFDSWQVIGNNDIEFSENFIEVINALPLRTDELVIAPDVITNNGIHENPHVVHRIPRWRKLMYDIYYSNYYIARLITLFYSDERKFKPFDPVRKHIYMGIGALYVLTPWFFKYFSQLWDDLFLYGEEALFGGQILSVNGKILYEPELRCYHNESSATSRLGAKRKYYIVKASYKIYKKYL